MPHSLFVRNNSNFYIFWAFFAIVKTFSNTDFIKLLFSSLKNLQRTFFKFFNQILCFSKFVIEYSVFHILLSNTLFFKFCYQILLFSSFVIKYSVFQNLLSNTLFYIFCYQILFFSYFVIKYSFFKFCYQILCFSNYGFPC